MNFAHKVIVYFTIFLLNIPLHIYAQTSWHITDLRICSWDPELKKWKDCSSEEAQMVFYFNEGLTSVTMVDWENKVRVFPIESIEDYDEENDSLDFNIIGKEGKELLLTVDFDDDYIALFDFSAVNFSEWKVLNFSYDVSTVFGSFISETVTISRWNKQKDEYVAQDGTDGVKVNVNIDFNSLSLQEQGKEDSKIDLDMEYSKYDSKNKWLLFEATGEDTNIYVFNNSNESTSNSKNITIHIFTDNVDGRYQSLMSLTNLTKNDVSEDTVVTPESTDSWKGVGSGIIFSTDGYIATNYHVIEDARLIEVEFKNRGKIRKFNAEVIKSDRTNDLAIIKINDDSFEDLPPLLYNLKTKTSDIGQSVFALGYPKSNIMGTDLKFTDGKISSRTGAMGDVTNYQTTTPIQSGNSGGPLFDTDGNLIAINSSKMVAEDIDNVSYSIKTIYLIPLIDALPENITLPSSRFLQGKDFTEQFKVLEKYVTLIRVK